MCMKLQRVPAESTWGDRMMAVQCLYSVFNVMTFRSDSVLLSRFRSNFILFLLTVYGFSVDVLWVKY